MSVNSMAALLLKEKTLSLKDDSRKVNVMSLITVWLYQSIK